MVKYPDSMFDLKCTFFHKEALKLSFAHGVY